MWWIRMPSITGEPRRPIDLHDLFPVSLTPPLKLSILLLFLSPARCMWLSWMVLRQWQGLRNTLLQAFAMSGPPGGMRLLDGPNRGQGARVPQVAPAPSQRGCRATRMDAQVGPQRTNQRQTTRPRASLPRRRVTSTRIPFRIRMRAGCCARRTGAGSRRRRPVARRVLERLRMQSPARSADADQNRPC